MADTCVRSGPCSGKVHEYTSQLGVMKYDVWVIMCEGHATETIAEQFPLNSPCTCRLCANHLN